MLTAPKREGEPDPKVERFRSEIRNYENTYGDWMKACERIVKRYRNEKPLTDPRTLSGRKKFNILWSNVQTQTPAYYAETPRMEVVRRYKDRDPLVRLAAELAERAGQYVVSEDDFDGTMWACVEDLLMPSRCTAWVRYDAIFDEEADPLEPPNGEEGDEGYEEPVYPVSSERVQLDHVLYKDFGHDVQRKWKDVTMVWRKVHMNRHQFAKRFGKEKLSLVSFGKAAKDGRGRPDQENNSGKCECIYEIWCKESRRVYWLADSCKVGFIAESEDFLRLKDFFPCPAPCYMDSTNDSMIPIPTFYQYAELADDLDILTQSHADLVEATQPTGCYDASQEDVGKIFNRRARTMKLVPAKNWAQLKQVGGVNGAIELIDIGMFAAAIPIIEHAIEVKKAQIEEMIGIADIMRGFTEPQETATAQRMKGNFAVGRLGPPRKRFAKFVRDCVALMTEVALEHMSDETLYQMTGVHELGTEAEQLFPTALQLLRDDKLRTYKMTVQTDSMISVDESAEQETRIKALDAVGTFFERTRGMVMDSPALGDVASQMMSFVVDSFNVGPSLTFAIERAFEKLREQAEESPPKGDPAAAQAEADAQWKQTELEFRKWEAEQRMALEREKDERAHSLEVDRLVEESALKQFELTEKLNIEREKLGYQAVQSARKDAQTASIVGIAPGEGLQ